MIKDRDSWETPKELWNELNDQYKFTFDCCASNINKKCSFYSINFLKYKKVSASCWMNPPFSKAFEMFEQFFKVINKGVAIYRCDNMETKVWQDVILKNASWIFIFNKRIQYEGQGGGGARFPSALIGFNVSPTNLINGKLLI